MATYQEKTELLLNELKVQSDSQCPDHDEVNRIEKAFLTELFSNNSISASDKLQRVKLKDRYLRNIRHKTLNLDLKSVKHAPDSDVNLLLRINKNINDGTNTIDNAKVKIKSSSVNLARLTQLLGDYNNVLINASNSMKKVLLKTRDEQKGLLYAVRFFNLVCMYLLIKRLLHSKIVRIFIFLTRRLYYTALKALKLA